MPALRGQHVDLGLAGERVGVGARRAPRADREGMEARRVRAPAAACHGAVVRDVVEVRGPALAGADDVVVPEAIRLDGSSPERILMTAAGRNVS